MLRTIRHIVSTLLPVALIWAVLIAIAFWQDAMWPETIRHVWGSLAIMATFLLFVSTLMLRRMPSWDWLTVSLVAAFAAVSMLPLYLLASRLWPLFFVVHRAELLITLCAVIIVPLSVAILLLAITPDERGEYE